MAKTIAQMTAEIEKLQRQIEAARSREVDGVVGRIREAIDFYGLTPEQLFGSKAKTQGNGKASRRTAAKPVKPVKPARAKVKLPAKYADGTGNEWTGRGSTPRWLQDALAAGKSKEDFALQAP
ncbi:H-NS family nucleoid-associated regulatory protein [Piscinibacter gummiphilus]|uniref:DNA-binding protein H-NS-like C-terminal domain-containing protein n=1 Tax=Piscinibacter gummiphilus TaxID=946333 RepID=A0A1W6L2U5_9BURK|nr:H-NS histone family protein [Piscinibacter gummiphilus]ARN18601.1 hypothetical protein A4W93_00975 [Piscinibacter gummiphilus]ATU63230.1 histidine biosynthesis protein [Piscinibacter gummiphilus]GLS95564.1 H-NS histone [Piscinibacter gummiphilus]